MNHSLSISVPSEFIKQEEMTEFKFGTWMLLYMQCHFTHESHAQDVPAHNWWTDNHTIFKFCSNVIPMKYVLTTCTVKRPNVTIMFVNMSYSQQMH